MFWKYATNLQENTHAGEISIKLQRNFIEIKLRHGFSPVNLLHIFRTNFLLEYLSTAASVNTKECF